MRVRVEVEEPYGCVHRLEFDLVDICQVELPSVTSLTIAMEKKEFVDILFRGRVHKIRAETHDLQTLGGPPPERLTTEDCVPCDDNNHERCRSNVHPCGCAMRGHKP